MYLNRYGFFCCTFMGCKCFFKQKEHNSNKIEKTTTEFLNYVLKGESPYKRTFEIRKN